MPVVVRIGDVEFGTALFPKDGRYLVPLKDVVRRSAGIEVDQVLAVGLNVGRPVRGAGTWKEAPGRASDLRFCWWAILGLNQ